MTLIANQKDVIQLQSNSSSMHIVEDLYGLYLLLVLSPLVALVEEFAAWNSKPSPLVGPACAKLAVVPGFFCRTWRHRSSGANARLNDWRYRVPISFEAEKRLAGPAPALMDDANT